jgi:hypothetical protein
MVQKGQSEDNGCRMGCKAVEDMHHIFVVYPKYAKLRDDAMVEVVKKLRIQIQVMELEETCATGLL